MAEAGGLAKVKEVALKKQRMRSDARFSRVADRCETEGGRDLKMPQTVSKRGAYGPAKKCGFSVISC